MDTSDYTFQHWQDDDAKLIAGIIEENFSQELLKDKVLIFFDESKDVSSVNLNTGEIAIKVYGDEVETKPRGIGFDSIEETRIVRVSLRTIDRDLYLGCLDEIRRIQTMYRLRPGNGWATLWPSKYTPEYPSEKFYSGILEITLKKYCNTLPLARDGWTQNEYY